MKVLKASIIAISLATMLGAGGAAAAGMDGHWSGYLSGEKGSGQADIVVQGKNVFYSYRQSAVPVAWTKVTTKEVTFGNNIYKMTLDHDGLATFKSQQYGDGSGTLTKQ